MLSVLVPVYNVEKYLSRCIDSILAQTYLDFELIIVDDGSSDKSAQICDAYVRRDSRIYVIHKENGGLGSARITGLEYARGEYVAFVDSDDYIQSNMYEELLEPFRYDSTIDISVGGYVAEDCAGIVNCEFVSGLPSVYPAIQAMNYMFECQMFNWSLCDKIYRRRLFENSIVMNNWPNSYGEDTYVNWMIFRHARNVAYKPLYGYHYCIHNDSMTRQPFRKEKLAYIDIWDQILEDSKSEPYVNCVLRWMFDEGSKFIYEMQREWSSYKKEIDRCRSIVNKNIKNFNYYMNTADQWKLKLLNQSQEDYLQYYSMFRNFANSLPYIFLYGTGAIADEVATEMERQGIVYGGVTVSKKCNIEKFHGKDVVPISQIDLSCDVVGFILAMNKENENSVRKLLGEMGYKNIFSAGKQSSLYI